MARNAKNLTIKTSIDASNDAAMTPRTEASTPGHSLGTQTPATPVNVRGRSDLRSPGISKTPTTDHPNANSNANSNADAAQDPVAANNNNAKDDAVPLPDFMTQTDRYGNATTPRNLNANGVIQETNTDETEKDSVPAEVQVDACDTLLESLRMMCCCILPESSQVDNDQKDTTSKNSSQPHKSHAYYPYNNNNNNGNNNGNANNNNHSNSQTAIMSPKQIVKDDVEGSHNIRLLPQITKGDNWFGKKCLVLDLDETLVHSSFRAVPGADFVIPVQVSFCLWTRLYGSYFELRCACGFYVLCSMFYVLCSMFYVHLHAHIHSQTSTMYTHHITHVHIYRLKTLYTLSTS